MTTNETQEILVALRTFQRDIAADLPVALFARTQPDECNCEFVRPDDFGKIERPTGSDWFEIKDKKEKQEVLAEFMVRLARDLAQATSRKKGDDARLLLPSWQIKGARKQSAAITYAPPFLQGGAPRLIQQK